MELLDKDMAGIAYAYKAIDSSTMFERRNICSPKDVHNA
jgi:hypothetical protein